MAKNHEEIIDSFRSIVKNPHEYARSIRKNGHSLAGYMCTHVPEEILYAAGIIPLRILTSRTSQALSRSYIHETYCSFCHDCAYEGLQNHYDYLDLLVTSSSCIHMGEAFNVWVRFAGFEGRSFLLPYPHIIHTKPALQFMVESYGEFTKFIERCFKRTISDYDIEQAIKVYNHTRRLLKQFWQFLKDENPPIAGSELAAVTLASQLMDKKEYNQMLEEIIPTLENKSRTKKKAVRLMVSGGACDNTEVLSLIEHLKYPANLVFVDSCTAARYFWFEVPEDRTDKLQAIAEGYSKRIPCPAKDNMPGTGEKKRFRFFKEFLDEFKPDGIVFAYQRFCSPQPMDVVALKPLLGMMGIPYVELELDSTIPINRFGTQLEALVEIIEKVTP